jgi:hypothetical protein
VASHAEHHRYFLDTARGFLIVLDSVVWRAVCLHRPACGASFGLGNHADMVPLQTSTLSVPPKIARLHLLGSTRAGSRLMALYERLS